LGYSPDQIAQDSIDRAQDALVTASFAPPPPPQLPPGRSAQQPDRNQPPANNQRPQRVPSQRVEQQ
jgi:hypothetical protein